MAELHGVLHVAVVSLKTRGLQVMQLGSFVTDCELPSSHGLVSCCGPKLLRHSSEQQRVLLSSSWRVLTAANLYG